ncbi:MAG: hypothetical protein GY838_12965 [bacterium]|nr:hypothetical protein [bacterium]
MSGSDLRFLRWGFAMDSARKLARRLGIAASTVYRNEKRETVTDYVSLRVSSNPLAAAFFLGMTGDRDAEQMELI